MRGVERSRPSQKLFAGAALGLLGLVLLIVLGGKSGGPDLPPPTAVESVADQGPDAVDARTGSAAAGSERADPVDSGTGILRQAAADRSAPSGVLRIVGRLVGEAGSTLPDTSFDWAHLSGRDARASGTTSTDGDGAFEIAWDGAKAPRGALAIEVAQGADRRSGAVVPLPKPEQPGVVSLGDVQISTYVLLASGRVEDDRGQPLAGAEVVGLARHAGLPSAGPADPRVQIFSNGNSSIELELVGGAGSGQQFRIRSLPTGEPLSVRFEGASTRQPEVRSIQQAVIVSGEGGGLQSTRTLRIDENGLLSSVARRQPFGRTRTDAEGLFRLFGPTGADSVLVRGRADGHREHAEELSPPGGFVTLRLPRVVEVRAEVWLPDFVAGSAMQYRLQGQGWSMEPSALKTETTGQGHVVQQLVFSDVPVGPTRFDAGLRHLEEPVCRIEWLIVDPERPIGLERLQPVDLRQVVFHYRVRAVEPNRRPIADLRSPLLLHVPQGKKERVVGLNWVDGVAEFYSSRPELDVTLLLAGYRRERVTLRPTDRELVYRPIHPVRILLPGLREAAADSDRVRVSVVLRSGTGLPQSLQGLDVRTGKSKSYSRWHLGRSGGAWLGDSDEVEVPLVLDGTYDVLVRLRRSGVSGEESIQVGQIDVKLDRLAAEQHVLQIDRAAIGAAVARQRARLGQPR